MRHQRRFREKMRDKSAYSMCDKKTKFKSSQASRMASKFNQRKYLCPICKQWHLTKDRR